MLITDGQCHLWDPPTPEPPHWWSAARPSVRAGCLPTRRAAHR